MIERDFGQDVIAFIKKLWLPMVDHGTTWESYNPVRGNGSSSHAWSAHPLFHLMQTIGGIRQTGVAWKEITFRPVFHGTYGRTSIPTPLGLITSEWKSRKEKIEVKIHLPCGIKARVELPGMLPGIVRKSTTWTLKYPKTQL